MNRTQRAGLGLMVVGGFLGIAVLVTLERLQSSGNALGYIAASIMLMATGFLLLVS